MALQTALRSEEVTLEDELILILVGTEDRRATRADRIAELTRVVSYALLAERLREQKLLALVGRRVIECAADPVPDSFASAVEAAAQTAKQSLAVASIVTARLCAPLEAEGIPVLALKGPALAERVYGDAAVRAPSRDVDLLVDRSQFDAAVEVLTANGFRREDMTQWVDGLPHYHVTLVPSEPFLPIVELHWRVHWYEKTYASRALERSQARGYYGRAPHPVDDLALLLIVYARDGFVGLRYAADIGAFWDKHRDELPDGALDGICAEHPELEAPIVAGALVCERLLGMPRTALVSAAARPPRRCVLASRLANWTRRADPVAAGTITLMDLLLLPRGGFSIFADHYYMQPVDHYIAEYGWDPRQRRRNKLRRFVHAVARIAQSPYKYGVRLWRVRGGRYLAEVPQEAVAQVR
jgi:hypothetical protein